MAQKRIVVLVSGNGTDLQAIIDGCTPGGWIIGAEVAGVVSSVAGVKALERAEKHQIPTAVIQPKDYNQKEQFNDMLTRTVLGYQPDLIVLAGFLVQVPSTMLGHCPVINIHPSLIPFFCGKGMYGLKVHEAVLASGTKITGATVHFVDENLDTGPIIDQLPVPVRDDDTPEKLQKRVMRYAEWKMLPWVIDHILNGRIRLEDGKVVHQDMMPLDKMVGWSDRVKHGWKL